MKATPQRLKLLDKQAGLNRIHCKECDVRKIRTQSLEKCEGCGIYEELLKIGSQLTLKIDREDCYEQSC